tara:strand:- start:4531 stop:4671 length:141 start_codon:yes stop_codon:yes gene_type:complete
MIVDIFDTLEKIDDLIDSSINKTIEIAKKIVLTDLSSKNDRKLLVK